MNDIATREVFASLGQTVEAMTAAVHAQTDVMRSLAEAMSRQHVESARATGGRVDFRFDGGGVGLWIAVTCCIIGMVLAATCFILFLNLDRKIDRALDYQTARYMMAPHTKPKEAPP
jgi:phage/plasmid primase-like uncharacterized protein